VRQIYPCLTLTDPVSQRLDDVCSSLEVTVSTPADDDHPALLLTGVSGPVPVGPGPKRAHSNGAGTRVPTRRVAVGKFSLLVAPLGLLCFVATDLVGLLPLAFAALPLGLLLVLVPLRWWRARRGQLEFGLPR
jgi:hypothetical protein